MIIISTYRASLRTIPHCNNIQIQAFFLQSQWVIRITQHLETCHVLSEGTESFWGSMVKQETLQRCVPLERWDVDRYYSPESGLLGMSYVRCAVYCSSLYAG